MKYVNMFRTSTFTIVLLAGAGIVVVFGFTGYYLTKANPGDPKTRTPSLVHIKGGEGGQPQSDIKIKDRRDESPAQKTEPVPAADNPPISTEAIPSRATAWDIKSSEKMQAAREALLLRVFSLSDVDRHAVSKELSEVVSDLSALAKILDETPEPFAPVNVSPPRFRKDGSPFPDQPLFSGMSPKAVVDPEQRKEYENIIRKRDEDEFDRSRIIEAGLVHSSVYNNLMRQLQGLVRRGVISKEDEKATLSAAGRHLNRKGKR
jgi:hypothetical protein